MIRPVKGGFRVFGKSGRNMGTYPSKIQAEERLAGIEPFASSPVIVKRGKHYVLLARTGRNIGIYKTEREARLARAKRRGQGAKHFQETRGFTIKRSPKKSKRHLRLSPAAKRHRHPDVEFHVESGTGTRVLKTFDEAAALAVATALAGKSVTIDVVVFSKRGANFIAGDDGVTMYEEDPDASVFERIVVHAENQGRIR